MQFGCWTIEPYANILGASYPAVSLPQCYRHHLVTQAHCYTLCMYTVFHKTGPPNSWR